MAQKAIDKEYLITQLQGFEENVIEPKYLSRNAGTENANKYLTVGIDGEITYTEANTSGEIDTGTFEINEDGELIYTYAEGDVDFEINTNGELIMTF